MVVQDGMKKYTVANHLEIAFEIDIQPKSNLHAWLQQKGVLPHSKRFTVKTVTLRKLRILSGLLLKMSVHDIDEQNLLQSVSKDSRIAALVIAVAVSNSYKKPKRRHIKFFLDNLKPEEMTKLFAMVLRRMDIMSFVSALYMMKGLNVLGQPVETSTES